jgi:hypothetical protein
MSAVERAQEMIELGLADDLDDALAILENSGDEEDDWDEPDGDGK